MKKLYTKNIYSEQLLFIATTLVLFILGAAVFHPTLGFFKNVRRRHDVNTLLTDMKKSDFSMREYWQFREFYSAGKFTFEPQVVSLAGALQFNEIPSPTATLLTYKSPYLTSTDSIIEITSSADYAPLHFPKETFKKLFVHEPDRIAYQTSDNKIHLVFIRSTAEMKQTLGVFDYGSKEDKALVGKLWLNETTLSE